MQDLPYLAGYEPELLDRVRELLAAGELLPRLAARYPEPNDVRSSRDLSAYVQAIKARHLRKTPPLSKVLYDDRMLAAQSVLGLNITTPRMHGKKTKNRRELRVASLFKEVPKAFLRMIVVHELAHLKHFEHDRDFYRLCEHMEPDYHQLELDLRLYLTAREA